MTKIKTSENNNCNKSGNIDCYESLLITKKN